MTHAFSDSTTEVGIEPGHLRTLEDPTERVIAPATRRLRLRDLLREGAVIRVLSSRDFKVKYKQSLLGPMWLVIQPLGLLAGFVVAFRHLANVQSSGVPYIVFALAGLCVWTFFQAALTSGGSSVISNLSFVRFTPCPRPAFPLAAIIASLPASAVTAVAAIVATTATGRLTPRILLLPLMLVWLFLFTAGVVYIISSLSVRYRDMLSTLPFVFQVGLFLAPVGYTLAALSPTMRALVELNPLTGIMEGWRWVLISGYHPGVTPVVYALVATVVVAAIGWRTFSRLEVTMADEI
jgi:ABC-type polysaccharide/polyol phosphate export permease